MKLLNTMFFFSHALPVISSIISFILVSIVAVLIVIHMRRKRESLVPQYLYEEPDTIIEGQKLLNTTVAANTPLSNDAEV
jgi:flagellar biosynthesis/type III secretory pathway M-ring protein FliF/YscJ